MRLVFTSVFILFATVTAAQDLLRLTDSVSKGANEIYVMERCAALDRAILNWGGEAQLNQFDPNLFNLISDRYYAQKLVAVLMHEQRGLTSKQAEEANNRTEDEIYNRYVKRFENNYASSGQAFNNDAFVNSDMDYCMPYAEMAGQTLDAAFEASNWRKALQ